MNVGGRHLTYCTNIHPAESWAEVRANLERHVVAVKQRICPDRPFGVGLRLSARAARKVDAHELRDWLDAHGLYVFTINGFPYGDFHGTRVKQTVYLPDWLDDARVAYTCRLGEILAVLLPPGVTGSISTVPGAFRTSGLDARRIADNLRRAGDHLRERDIWLAVEPEPACLLETTAEAIEFLRVHELTSVALCLDACHAAVQFEPPSAPDVHVAKVQLSCGLVVAPVDPAARAELARFADDVYLHQVVAQHAGELRRYVDLPDALADPSPADEWRIHFHVPIFRQALGRFASTQAYLAELLARGAPSTHLEVETYTWDVLPAEFRAEPIVDAIARELRWVIDRLPGQP